MRTSWIQVSIPETVVYWWNAHRMSLACHFSGCCHSNRVKCSQRNAEFLRTQEQISWNYSPHRIHITAPALPPPRQRRFLNLDIEQIKARNLGDVIPFFQMSVGDIRGPKLIWLRNFQHNLGNGSLNPKFMTIYHQTPSSAGMIEVTFVRAQGEAGIMSGSRTVRH